MFPFQKYKLYRSQSIETDRFEKKKVGIITSDDYNHQLEDFLRKILSAIHIDSEDCEICKSESDAERFEYILNFDGEHENIKYAFQHNGRNRLMFADSLKSIEQSKDLKILLWNALKKEFEV